MRPWGWKHLSYVSLWWGVAALEQIWSPLEVWTWSWSCLVRDKTASGKDVNGEKWESKNDRILKPSHREDVYGIHVAQWCRGDCSIVRQLWRQDYLTSYSLTSQTDVYVHIFPGLALSTRLAVYSHEENSYLPGVWASLPVASTQNSCRELYSPVRRHIKNS